MGKKQSLGLLFSYDEKWIGGSYYILNIIKTLNRLEDIDKPKLFVLCSNMADFDIVKETKYPYLNFVLIERKSLFKPYRAINKMIQKFGFTLFKRRNQFKNIDILFPATFEKIFDGIPNKIFWIPDFQEKYLPHLFQESELVYRQDWQAQIANQRQVIFSSKNALNDFTTFFPNATSKKYVFNFSSILPEITVKIEDVLQKYNLTSERFFFSPNQFWEHKNHLIILKALDKLRREQNLDFQVYFSGKEDDYRNPDYFKNLKKYVEENNLSENVKFLGFIDRTDQLCFIDNAMGIIQPSLFEGWSTVVEDSKALNQNIIVSNIGVHKEQLNDKAFFFDPNSEDSLIEQLAVVKKIGKKSFDFDYEKTIQKNATDLLEILDAVAAESK